MTLFQPSIEQKTIGLEWRPERWDSFHIQAFKIVVSLWATFCMRKNAVQQVEDTCFKLRSNHSFLGALETLTTKCSIDENRLWHKIKHADVPTSTILRAAFVTWRNMTRRHLFSAVTVAFRLLFDGHVTRAGAYSFSNNLQQHRVSRLQVPARSRRCAILSISTSAVRVRINLCMRATCAFSSGSRLQAVASRLDEISTVGVTRPT